MREADGLRPKFRASKQTGGGQRTTRLIVSGYPNHRLVKIHRNYTVEEIADLFSKHKNTVRSWIKEGLPTIDDRRPSLVLGSALALFLQTRRANKKRPCQPGEMYCVRCRMPKFRADGMVDYKPFTEATGNLSAICPDCNTLMNRIINRAQLGAFRPESGVTFPQALRHVSEMDQLTLNSDLR